MTVSRGEAAEKLDDRGGTTGYKYRKYLKARSSGMHKLTWLPNIVNAANAFAKQRLLRYKNDRRPDWIGIISEMNSVRMR
jgi:hypothetical protein